MHQDEIAVVRESDYYGVERLYCKHDHVLSRVMVEMYKVYRACVELQDVIPIFLE